MKLLLKQATILDPSSPYNGLIKDILVTDGIIEKIENSIVNADHKVIEASGLMVSNGWIDIFSHFNDPGFEYKETLETGAKAAASGGFTHVFVLPNTQPVASNKTAVEYIVQKSKSLAVNVVPIGAITKNIEGKELSEMYDMYNSGAIAFSDGLQPVQTPGLLLKAFQYVKAINAVLIQVPVDKSISKFGLMNEGITSTRLGLPGIPAIAEELMVARDIELAKYTGSKLHITGISTAKSLQVVIEAKANGVSITCSVTPHHLAFCDEDLATYDTNFKTDPPLRSREDMLALRRGVEDGTIDCIASHHLPQDWDNKTCEFEYAAAGMIGLETVFGVINNIFPHISAGSITDLLGNNARNIFGLNQFVIKENEVADITLFTKEGEFVYDSASIKSKSKNSPFINKQLKGKVIGIINKDRVYLND
ncbi:dihydroorotase [Segetibacter koreensis]|uniref:dihydroorotase n=1 Tax=Segetibacter koreensis TaxID=398037 RepID=UPI0003622526|nr:dihydroorotase [Segetibacter koreensis]